MLPQRPCQTLAGVLRRQRSAHHVAAASLSSSRHSTYYVGQLRQSALDLSPTATTRRTEHQRGSSSTRDVLTARPFAVTPGPPARFKVAVDVDEVLGRFLHRLNEFCKEKYNWDYKESDYFVYEFAKIWHCSQEQSNAIVHEFFQSPHFKDGIEAIPGARTALESLSASCDLVVVTSRQHVIENATLEWLDRHYGGIFQNVYFGNHWAQSGPSKKKSDICRQAGAHVLIDDNVGYAAECAAAGIHVLLYDWKGAYPWSKLPPGASREFITIVHDWDEVECAMQSFCLKQHALHHR